MYDLINQLFLPVENTEKIFKSGQFSFGGGLFSKKAGHICP